MPEMISSVVGVIPSAIGLFDKAVLLYLPRIFGGGHGENGMEQEEEQADQVEQESAR